MTRRRPTDEDRMEALRLVLSGLANDTDLFDVVDSVAGLHPRQNTFPGEVFLGLAVDALERGGVTRDNPLPFEGLVSTYLPECEFRRRDLHKMRTAIMLAASLHGGVEPDLFDEVAEWQTDDYWRYALFAAVAFIRAVANRRGVPVAEIARELVQQHGVQG